MNKKETVVFFDRSELTYLYADVSNVLYSRFNIIHIAYSDNEMKILNQIVENKSIIHFQNEIKDILEANKNVNKGLLEEVDSFMINNTDGRFNLNSSIQSDRGFSILSYSEALLLAQAYYLFWKKFFSETKVSFFWHELPSLLFNHIASVMCKYYNAYYLHQSMSRGIGGRPCYINIIGDDYNAIEIAKNYSYYSLHPEKINMKKSISFLNEFRADYNIFLGNLIKAKATGVFSFFVRSVKDHFRSIRGRRKYNKLLQNIDYWLATQYKGDSLRYKNLKQYEKIKFDEVNDGDEYYYYSIHLEPEATVLYLGDGIYTNQVKLIENIAAALPVGCYLYVKDHPHEYGYRSVEDYKRLKRIPNIKLLKTSIPGKQVIKNSKGVFTINGTAGFEALLLGKQVYVFGKSFYTMHPRVCIVKNIRDLRVLLYKNRNMVFQDDDLFPFINAYLDSLHIGVVDFFQGRANKYGLNLKENAMQIANDFLTFSERH
jgi:hypothetical protein